MQVAARPGEPRPRLCDIWILAPGQWFQHSQHFLLQAEAERRLIISALADRRNERFVLIRQAKAGRRDAALLLAATPSPASRISQNFSLLLPCRAQHGSSAGGPPPYAA